MFNIDNYIAVDWGSSNRRLWVFQNQVCVWHHSDSEGAAYLQPDTFSQSWHTLLDRCPCPLDNSTIVIMSGMVGSNVGWLTAPYLRCPTDISSLASCLTPVKNAGPFPLFIVPGLQLPGPDIFDVMRGEETQLLGALGNEQWYVLPGTHSKWIKVKNGIVEHFQTAMTGEMFHLMSTHSLLRQRQTLQQNNLAELIQGAEWGAQENCLTRGLFSLRARMLCHALEPDYLHSILSGYLIGHEIARMQEFYRLPKHTKLVLIGNENLIERYRNVLSHFGLSCRLVSGETAFLSGIRSILNANTAFNVADRYSPRHST